MRQIPLCDDWYVYARDDAFQLTSSIPKDAAHVSIPFDALFRGGQRPDAPTGGATAFFDGPVYYFQRTLVLNGSWHDKALYLKLEGAFSKSFVYVNGSQVATGDFGYASVTADIGDFVRWDGSNTFLVVVKTDSFSSRWYCGCGLMRPVYLYVGEPVHTELDSLFVSTERLSEQGAHVRILARLVNEALRAQTTDVLIRVRDGKEVVVEQRYPVRIRDTFELDVRLFVPGIRPWSTKDPKLYEVELQVADDVTSLRTGFRTISVDPQCGLLVNGTPTLLRGACIHHDEGILGGVSTLAYELWRVSLLKEAGFNAVRSAHNHASAELLAACDELGVFVLDEVCDMWTKMKGFGDFAQYFMHSWETVTKNMVVEDRNHPSVVGYSTGNEISDINTEKGFEVAHDLYTLIHSLDATRFVTNGVNGAFAAGDQLIDIACDITGRDRATFESGDVNQLMSLMATQMDGIVKHPVVSRVLERLDPSVDVAGYNYMTERYAADAEQYPQRVMLGTETNPRRIAENWAIIKALPSLIGEFTWTGWDYLGELGALAPAAFPQWRNDSGDLSLFGVRTPVSFWREIVFGLRKEPYIAVRPPEAHDTPREFGPWKFTDAVANWTWDIAEGTPMTVEVYSADPVVELYLDGKLVGRTTTNECYALIEVPYAAGTLTATGPSGLSWQLSSMCGKTHVVYDDFEAEGYVISRIHLEDEAGTLAFGDGRTLDCTREGLALVAAASEESLPPFADKTIRLVGQGALAIYRKREDS